MSLPINFRLDVKYLCIISYFMQYLSHNINSMSHVSHNLQFSLNTSVFVIYAHCYFVDCITNVWNWLPPVYFSFPNSFKF